MKCVAIMVVLIMSGATTATAHAQNVSQHTSSTGQPSTVQTGQPVAETPPSSLQVPQTSQGQGEVVATQPPVASSGSVEAAAAPDRQAMMRELQEQGREAVIKSRALQATDPVAAQKMMQDYYQMRQDKMKEMRETERTQAAEKRAQKRQQAQQKAADKKAAPAAVRRDEQNAAEKRETEREKTRRRQTGQVTQ